MPGFSGVTPSCKQGSGRNENSLEGRSGEASPQNMESRKRGWVPQDLQASVGMSACYSP